MHFYVFTSVFFFFRSVVVDRRRAQRPETPSAWAYDWEFLIRGGIIPIPSCNHEPGSADYSHWSRRRGSPAASDTIAFVQSVNNEWPGEGGGRCGGLSSINKNTQIITWGEMNEYSTKTYELLITVNKEFTRHRRSSQARLFSAPVIFAEITFGGILISVTQVLIKTKTEWH